MLSADCGRAPGPPDLGRVTLPPELGRGMFTGAPNAAPLRPLFPTAAAAAPTFGPHAPLLLGGDDACAGLPHALLLVGGERPADPQLTLPLSVQPASQSLQVCRRLPNNPSTVYHPFLPTTPTPPDSKGPNDDPRRPPRAKILATLLSPVHTSQLRNRHPSAPNQLPPAYTTLIHLPLLAHTHS